MKKLHIVGLAIVAVFAFSAFAASSAFAVEPQWLVGGKIIASSVAVKSSIGPAGLFLQDMQLKIAILCEEGTNAGFVLPKGADEVTEAVCTKLKVVEGACVEPSVEAINLPWTTQLTEPETGVFVDLITKGTGGNGAAGWSVGCLVLGILGFDKCTTNLGSTLIESEAGGAINATFREAEPEANWAACSLSGNKLVGLVVGLILIKTNSGEALTASLE